MPKKIPTFESQVKVTPLGWHPCKCGCETLVPPYADFVRGHTFRIFPTYTNTDRSETQRDIWARYTPQEKEERLSISVLSENSIQKSRETQKQQLASLPLKEREEKFLNSFHSYLGKRNASKAASKRDHTGENNPNWKGGHDHYYGYGWTATRELILVRDNDTCQSCGSKIRPEVHHIDGNIDNIDEHNLITTCHSCNTKAASILETTYWQTFYQNRIKEIYGARENPDF